MAVDDEGMVGGFTFKGLNGSLIMKDSQAASGGVMQDTAKSDPLQVR